MRVPPHLVRSVRASAGAGPRDARRRRARLHRRTRPERTRASAARRGAREAASQDKGFSTRGERRAFARLAHVARTAQRSRRSTGATPAAAASAVPLPRMPGCGGSRRCASSSRMRVGSVACARANAEASAPDAVVAALSTSSSLSPSARATRSSVRSRMTETGASSSSPYPAASAPVRPPWRAGGGICIASCAMRSSSVDLPAAAPTPPPARAVCHSIAKPRARCVPTHPCHAGRGAAHREARGLRSFPSRDAAASGVTAPAREARVARPRDHRRRRRRARGRQTRVRARPGVSRANHGSDRYSRRRRPAESARRSPPPRIRR